MQKDWINLFLSICDNDNSQILSVLFWKKHRLLDKMDLTPLVLQK